MGTFSAQLRVWNPATPDRVEQLEVLVDTGAAYSWISRNRLERIGVTASRRMPFRTIEGRIRERDVAIVYIATDGYSVPDLVVMAEAGEAEVPGRAQYGRLGRCCGYGAKETRTDRDAGVVVQEI